MTQARYAMTPRKATFSASRGLIGGKRHARRVAALGEQLVQERHVDEIDRDQK